MPSSEKDNTMGRESLILADVHANLAALEAVLEKEKIWDEVLFLGDAVHYGPHPQRVLSLLSELNGIHVAGNTDAEVLDGESRDLFYRS